jgi:hypothetical protein
MHKINHFVELDVKGGRIESVASIIVKSFPTIFYHLGLLTNILIFKNNN